MVDQTIIELHSTICKQLNAAYHDEHLASQHAWWILESISGKNQAILIAHDIAPFSKKDFEKIEEWIKKITIEQMPLQYLIGSVPFDGVEIVVKPPVLIPRPETEEWCTELIKQLHTLQNKKLAILDIACGSGCIALAIAHAVRETTVDGIDISQDALTLSEHNKKYNAVNNVNFFYSDLFSHVTYTYDTIVSNPPYIAGSEWKTLEPSVKNWEDKNALVAPNHGLEIIENIIEKAPGYLKNNAELVAKQIANVWIEIGYKQGNAVFEIMKAHKYTNIQVHQDLYGKDRYVTGIAPIQEK